MSTLSSIAQWLRWVPENRQFERPEARYTRLDVSEVETDSFPCNASRRYQF